MNTAIDEIAKLEMKILESEETIDDLNRHIHRIENNLYLDVMEDVKSIKTNEKERQIMLDQKIDNCDDLQQAYAQRRNLMHIKRVDQIERDSLFREHEILTS